MKTRSRTIKITVMMFAVSLISFAAWCNDCMDIDTDVFENNKRPFVCFAHDEHNENAGIEDCAACHHVYDESGKLVEGESSEDYTCAECHDPEGDTKHMELISRYHERCRSCHLELEKGPVACGECHKR